MGPNEVPLETSCRDASAEWHKRYSAAIKSKALGLAQGLRPMLHEVWIFGVENTEEVCHIPQPLLEPMAHAREVALELLSSAKPECFDDIKTVLLGAQAQLLGYDRSFSIELDFVRGPGRQPWRRPSAAGW
jgi:hypothetical protein